MSVQTVRLPFCGKEIDLELPGTWEIAATLEPRPAQRLEDVGVGLLEALDAPVGCESLTDRDLSGMKIVLAVDDISRPTPTHLFFMDLVRFLLDRGASKEDILVIAALGIHRDMTQEEFENRVGPEAAAGLHWINHDCRSVEAHVDLGSTSRGTPVLLNRHLVEADLILCAGAIEPHLLLGFGGGLKMILPGLAHQDTIQRNHMQGVSPDKFNYIGEHESPMRLDIEEAVGKLGKEIHIVNALMNRDMELCRFVCGDPVQAHREGVRFCESLYGRRIPGPADVVIVVSNPMNYDLRQGMKSMGNVEPGARAGGLILGLLECREGIGDVTIPEKAPSNRVLRFILKILGKNRILWFIDKVKKGAGIEERFVAHFSMQVVRKNRLMVHSPNLPTDTGLRMGLFTQFDDPGAMIRAAAKIAPRHARVHIYPHGGATYPILPRPSIGRKSDQRSTIGDRR